MSTAFVNGQVLTAQGLETTGVVVDGGRIVYMLQCPRCGVNARVRADVLTSVLDVLVSTGNDSVTLQYINRLAAAVRPDRL